MVEQIERRLAVKRFFYGWKGILIAGFAIGSSAGAAPPLTSNEPVGAPVHALSITHKLVRTGEEEVVEERDGPIRHFDMKMFVDVGRGTLDRSRTGGVSV